MSNSIPTTKVLYFDGKEFRPVDWPTFALPKNWAELEEKVAKDFGDQLNAR